MRRGIQFTNGFVQQMFSKQLSMMSSHGAACSRFILHTVLDTLKKKKTEPQGPASRLKLTRGHVHTCYGDLDLLEGDQNPSVGLFYVKDVILGAQHGVDH